MVCVAAVQLKQNRAIATSEESGGHASRRASPSIAVRRTRADSIAAVAFICDRASLTWARRDSASKMQERR